VLFDIAAQQKDQIIQMLSEQNEELKRYAAAAQLILQCHIYPCLRSCHLHRHRHRHRHRIFLWLTLLALPSFHFAFLCY
jgi:hypothetical protein